jgi:hypothetical protein
MKLAIIATTRREIEATRDDAMTETAHQLRGQLESEWVRATGGQVVDDAAVHREMAKLLVNGEDLMAQEAPRREFMRDLAVDCIISARVSVQVAAVRLEASVCAAPSGASVPYTVTVDKTKAMRLYLGEPVPGTLLVRAPGEARVIVDQVQRGHGGSHPVEVELPAGHHSVLIEKDAYKSFSQNFVMGNDQTIRLSAKERNNSSAPLRAALFSMVAPGFGMMPYSNYWDLKRKRVATAGEGVAAWGALLFYGGGVWWFVDHFGYELNWLKQDRSRSTEAQIALGVTGIGYAMNLGGAFAVGMEFSQHNRELVRGKFGAVVPGEEDGTGAGQVAVLPWHLGQVPECSLALKARF